MNIQKKQSSMDEIGNLSAFPHETRSAYTGAINGVNPGMTLRDYFAAKAMQSIINHEKTEVGTAELAYSIADAMIKEREKYNNQ